MLTPSLLNEYVWFFSLTLYYRLKAKGVFFSVCFLYIGDNNLLRLHSDLKYLSHVVSHIVACILHISRQAFRLEGTRT
jgi:hypothetical protein